MPLIQTQFFRGFELTHTSSARRVLYATAPRCGGAAVPRKLARKAATSGDEPKRPPPPPPLPLLAAGAGLPLSTGEFPLPLWC